MDIIEVEIVTKGLQEMYEKLWELKIDRELTIKLKEWAERIIWENQIKEAIDYLERKEKENL